MMVSSIPNKYQPQVISTLPTTAKLA